MKNLNIPVGVSDFTEIRKNGYYYIDKTLFIKEIIEDGEERSSANASLLERLNQHNVKNAIDDIRKQSSTLRRLEEEGKIKIVGANYDVETGVVTWI